PRIADALTKEPVEGKRTRGDQWVHVVGVVECVEHFDLWNDREAFTEFERTLQPPIQRDKLVVLTQAVATRALTRIWADRLRRMRLHPNAGDESFAKVPVRKEVELVAFVAI